MIYLTFKHSETLWIMESVILTGSYYLSEEVKLKKVEGIPLQHFQPLVCISINGMGSKSFGP